MRKFIVALLDIISFIIVVLMVMLVVPVVLVRRLISKANSTFKVELNKGKDSSPPSIDRPM